tara:strand:+ start:349 stop:570 length:222 start_codon:yes stop_codon:yes gene_type:complete
MNINDFINGYHSIITKPLIINDKFGFELNNGFRWFFKNTELSHTSKKTLQKVYKDLNLTHVSGNTYISTRKGV